MLSRGRIVAVTEAEFPSNRAWPIAVMQRNGIQDVVPSSLVEILPEN